ncbi:hypothetical protein A9Q98_09280 [Thalassotalea sp. 42_200_T64]|nr:hypothetical protein A9Q98_09280 [Thalassotalea sp. 42_200_T64]
MIKFNFRQFPGINEKAKQPWNVDVHLMRIVATPDEVGEPTPEGFTTTRMNLFVCTWLIVRILLGELTPFMTIIVLRSKAVP